VPEAAAEPKTLERQNWLFSIDAYTDDAVLTLPDKQGHPQRTLVDLADVAGCLCKQTAPPTRWYGVKEGVVAVGMSYKGEQRWLVVRKAARATIRVDSVGKSQTLEVHLPNLLGELQGRGDEKGQVWMGIGYVYAFAGELNPATPLLACPLPNCYGDGRVCMGDVKEKLFRNLTPLAFFEKAFIESTFTDHAIAEPLASGFGEKGRKFENILQAIRLTKGKIPLPALKEIGTYAKKYLSK
jgi:hypothetical protein